MSQFLDNMQYRLKTSSTSLFTFFMKLFSGSVVGLTIAIVGQQIIGYGSFSFILFIVVCTAAFLRVARDWKLGGVLIFDLIMVLLGILLRMYVMIAPGA